MSFVGFCEMYVMVERLVLTVGMAGAFKLVPGFVEAAEW